MIEVDVGFAADSRKQVLVGRLRAQLGDLALLRPIYAMLPFREALPAILAEANVVRESGDLDEETRRAALVRLALIATEKLYGEQILHATEARVTFCPAHGKGEPPIVATLTAMSGGTSTPLASFNRRC